MKLTKEIGKKVMMVALVAMSMTGMMFASGSQDTSESPVISGETSWLGVIDGIAIDVELNTENNTLEGSITSLLQTDTSNVQLSVLDASGLNVASMILGVPGDLEFHETMIKENTTILGGYASAPVVVYLDASTAQNLLSNGWKVAIDSDNAPKYGVFENGELLATKATHVSDSFVINEAGIQTVVDFSYEDEGFSGTVTNYTNKSLEEVETVVALNNGSSFTFTESNVQPGQTVSFSYDSGVSGFNLYAVETHVN